MITRIADVIQPDIWTPYTIQQTMERSALVQSGIIVNDSELDRLASESNVLINMPYWEDLGNEESQVMKNEGDMTTEKIKAGQDMARKQARVQSWGANGLAALLSGDDPASAISRRVSAYWERDLQRNLLSTLSGVFQSTTMTEKIYDISEKVGADGVLGMNTFLDATQLMGDAKNSLTAVMMNSAVETELRKQDLIEYIPQSEQGLPIPYFNGKRVHVDDGMPENTMYIFGEGAIGLGNGSHPRIVPTEIVRNGLAFSGEEKLVNRRIFVLHPRGIAWQEGNGVTDQFPTNAELATGTKWSRVYEPKAVRIVKFKFNLTETIPAG